METGVPVMVHTNAAEQTGLLALETLTGHGVDPSRIVIAHAGRQQRPRLPAGDR
jgi:phosphotriesterase-related protein